jgi:hypothetical protein
LAKAALLTIHGPGEQRPGYANELRAALQSRLGMRSRHLAFEEVCYEDLLRGPERDYWAAVKPELRWQDLRRFVLFGLADAAALERELDRGDGAYACAQERLATALLRAWSAMGRSDGPIVFIAHSLGGHLLSNYLWDMQQAARGRPTHGIWTDLAAHAAAIADAIAAPGSAEIAFLQRPSIRAIFTTGCTIALHLATLRGVAPIEKPSPAFEWHNFYDRDDLLGWPLASASPEYAALVTDHATNAGGAPAQWLMKSWNPLAHGSYWRDGAVLERLCGTLTEALDGYVDPEPAWPRGVAPQRPLPMR